MDNHRTPSGLQPLPAIGSIVMVEDATRIGPRLRGERRRAGLSHARLAQLTGLSKTYLVRLETDPASNPSLEVLHRIADALDVTVADLVGTPRVQFEPGDAPIPPSLRAFADQAELSQRELRTLASIRWRKGEEPQTQERWRFILDSLRASRQLDERRD
jgi:XRE family transcriptional regulator, master regulator for biofilm formation